MKIEEVAEVAEMVKRLEDGAATSEALAKLDAAMKRYGIASSQIRPEVAELLRRRDS